MQSLSFVDLRCQNAYITCNCIDTGGQDRKSTRLNSSHTVISYAVFCLEKKRETRIHVVCSARSQLRRRLAQSAISIATSNGFFERSTPYPNLPSSQNPRVLHPWFRRSF